MKLVSRLAALAIVASFAVGCSSITVVDPSDFNGRTDAAGQEIAHANQTKWAINLLLFSPLWGDATLETSVNDLTREAADRGYEGVRIVQSDTSMLWWAFFPFTLILTPVNSNVAADFVQR